MKTRARRERTDWTPERIRKLRDLAAEGYRRRHLAAALGLSAEAVSARLTQERRAGTIPPFEGRAKQPRRAPAPPRPQPAHPAAQAVSCVSQELLVVALAEGLSLSVPHAETLAILLLHIGVELSFDRLRDLHGKHRRLGNSALYERISTLRRVLGQDAIGGYRTCAERSVGGALRASTYYLSDEGMQACEQALLRIAARLPLQLVAVRGAA